MQERFDFQITPKKEDKLSSRINLSPMMSSEIKPLYLSDEEPEEPIQPATQHHTNYRAYESPSRLLNLRTP